MLDIGSLLSGAGGILNTILSGNAQRRAQERAMQFLREIMAKQEQDFQQARASLSQGERDYMSDPGRARYLQEAEALMGREGPFNAGAVSLLKAGASDQAARTAAAQSMALREQLQRQGIRGGMALSAQQQQTAAANTEAGRRRNDITLQTAQAQEDYRRKALEQYHQIVGGDAATRYSMKENVAHLFGSKQYGNSTALTGAFG